MKRSTGIVPKTKRQTIYKEDKSSVLKYFGNKKHMKKKIRYNGLMIELVMASINDNFLSVLI